MGPAATKRCQPTATFVIYITEFQINFLYYSNCFLLPPSRPCGRKASSKWSRYSKKELASYPFTLVLNKVTKFYGSPCEPSSKIQATLCWGNDSFAKVQAKTPDSLSSPLCLSLCGATWHVRCKKEHGRLFSKCGDHRRRTKWSIECGFHKSLYSGKP